MESTTMQNSAMWVAAVFGPLMAIVGFWMMMYTDNMMKVMTSLKNTPAAFYLMGTLNMLFGLAILNIFNVWSWDKYLLVTLLGWVLLVRGVGSLFAPHLVMKASMGDQKNAKVFGIIPLVWGLALCWVGYMA